MTARQSAVTRKCRLPTLQWHVLVTADWRELAVIVSVHCDTLRLTLSQCVPARGGRDPQAVCFRHWHVLVTADWRAVILSASVHRDYDTLTLAAPRPGSPAGPRARFRIPGLA
jgi:hypothetical protein